MFQVEVRGSFQNLTLIIHNPSLTHNSTTGTTVPPVPVDKHHSVVCPCELATDPFLSLTTTIHLNDKRGRLLVDPCGHS